MLIEILEKQKFLVNSKPIIGSFSLELGEICLLIGENGVGKTTFFEYLKLNSQELFVEEKANFLSQEKLNPLNKVSARQCLNELTAFRYEKTKLFDEWSSNVSDYLDKPIVNLSGGQNQMIKILISLYLGGDFFFFDEPLHFLDKKNKALFLALLKSLKALGKGIVIIEHQSEELKKLVDKEYSLESEADYIKIGLC